MKKNTIVLFSLFISFSVFTQIAIPLEQDKKSNSKTNDAPGDDVNWMAAMQKDIAGREYHISEVENGQMQSPNRSQNLRFYYDPMGFSMETRLDSLKLETWKVRFELSGIYRGEHKIMLPSSSATMHLENNQLRYFHEDGFTMEYLNDMGGMRQNFIVNERPIGEGMLSVRLSVTSELEARLDQKNELMFYSPTNESEQSKVRYNDLKVIDANGNIIESWMEYKDNVLALVVNDQNAFYPLTIDPLSTTASAMLESNKASAAMGYSVSTAGDVNGDGFSDVIVGAYNFDNGQTNEGAAFIYHGSASGISTTTAAILESNQVGAQMGWSVSHAGDVNGDGFSDVIVGAQRYDNGQTDEGAAFIYHGSASGINATSAATLESNQAAAYMGGSLSTAGDVNGDGYSDVIVGAYLYDNGQINEGAAFVYHGSALGISTTASTLLESNQASAYLGYSVSTAGDVNGDGFSDVIVGAQRYDNGQTDEGAAFIYHGSASGINATSAATLESNQAAAYMGGSLSTAGDVNGDGYSDVIVGAYWYDNGQTNEGAAFIYNGSASGISATSAATLESNQANTWMGSVSTAGDVNGDGYSDVIVGAIYYDNGQTDEGAAFIYHGSASGISTTSATTIESNQGAAYLGYSVSTAGDINGDGFSDVIVGAYLYDNGQTDEGAAFVYHGSASGISTVATAMVESNQATALMGNSVSTAGDVNGDGFSDVIVGAYLYDNGQTDEGAAFIYHGSASGINTTAATMVESNQASALMGNSVSTAGDVNGDGFSDVIVGAIYYDNGQADEGAAFIYHGSASGVNTTATAIVESNQVSAWMGFSVSVAGDVNGDGYSDIIVGAYLYNNGQTEEGAAFIYHGSASGISSTPATIVESNQASAQMGYSVSTAGDLNGDGYSDVIVGAFRYDNGQADEGAAFIYHGSASGISTVATAILESNQASATMGASVSTAGDVNGDGYSDVIVGAPAFDNGQTDEGAAFIYHGSALGISTTASTLLESNQAGAYLGYSASTAGDVNGDGYSDVIVGARLYDNGQTDEGAAFIYHGSALGISTTASTMIESNQASAYLGTSVSAAGDVNGDGYSDVIVGAPYFDNGQAEEGRTFIYHGNGNSNKMRNTRQYRSNLTTPVQTGNSAGANFGIGHFARSNYGRTKVKLVWEIYQEGVGFTGSPITNSIAYQGISSNWTDIGTAGIEIKQLLATVGINNKWRVRVKYHPATMIDGQVYSRWFYGGIHDKEEMSIRGCNVSATQSQIDLTCNGAANGSATVVASGGPTPFTYTWSPAGGSSSTATGLSAGVYTCTITASNGCLVIKTFTITEPSAISLSAASQTNVSCNGGSDGAASINAATGGTGAYGYNWTPGNPAGDGTVSVSGLTAGTWTCTVTDASGCTATQDFILTEPIAMVIPSLSDLSDECPVNPAAPVTNNSCGGTTTGTTTAVFPITAQGTTVVTWTFDDGNGNTATTTQSVIIDDVTAPAAPVLNDLTGLCSVTPSVPTATDNCAGTVMGTTSTPFPITNQGTTTITWTFDDGNGNTSTATQNVNINTINTAVTAAGNVLTANAVGATFQWLDCDNGNSIIAGETNQTYTPANTGNYAVELTQNSCVDTSACFLVDYSGIKDQSSTPLLVYPNPSMDGHFSIKLDGTISAIELFDITGRAILIPYALDKGTINASKLESGKYLIRIYSNKGVFVEQLVIAK